MIDAHAHLEQSDYENDRDAVIRKCMEELKAVVTCCAQPKHWTLTSDIIEKYPNFLFATAGLHPAYVTEVSSEQERRYFRTLRKNKERIHAIGECGLDYKVARNEEGKEKQKRVFKRQIKLSEELDLPLVIHSRWATKPAVKILESFDKRRVLMHFFGVERLLDRILENGWKITLNSTLLGSKEMQKIGERTPLDQILLETDAPWLGGSGRNTPLTIKKVADKLAKIKGIDFENVWEQCGENAIAFYKLPL